MIFWAGGMGVLLGGRKVLRLRVVRVRVFACGLFACGFFACGLFARGLFAYGTRPVQPANQRTGSGARFW
ncbi:hypothetical protein B7P34_32840 [Streptosporangium nondiastaticum]|uniref:Uncharacterized protein n=1 Tax=Streptosporangium nondiastaticum TaxID=35764 RepID=A0A9X7JIZ8_9ACTN|nr:hypothetical protein B7P34_32840 [Streptosporangium nondiastaticum]